MKPSNLSIINKSFEKQAENFESSSMNFSNEDYINYVISAVTPKPSDTMLEVAAGTCAVGRSFSPYLKNVVCLDATTAMLEAGKKEAHKKHIDNIMFVKGFAEDLPFLSESFDIVISRLAFHHFTDIHRPFNEMVRVLKPSGKLVLIDMEASEESLRKQRDSIETLRDPSHIHNLSSDEIADLFYENSLEITFSDKKTIPVSLDSWLSLTKTPQSIREKITTLMIDEIQGKSKTGFAPYLKEKNIFFDQNWLLTIGKKPDNN